MLEIIIERKHSSPRINMDGSTKHFVHAHKRICVMLALTYKTMYQMVKFCSQLCAYSLIEHQDCNLDIKTLIKGLYYLSCTYFLVNLLTLMPIVRGGHGS